MKQKLKKNIKKVLASRTVITRLCRLMKKPVAIVLAYHDVGRAGGPASWLRIPQPQFDEQLGALGQFCHFIQPDDLFDPAALRPDRPNLLITFDDGYNGNYRYALPVLEKHRIPALFFISTANLQSGELFWFDKLVVPIQAQNIDYLDLRGKGLGEYRFRSNGDPDRRWLDLHQLLEDTKRLGNPDTPKAKAVIDFFSEKFSHVLQAHADEFRPLKPDELTAMARHPLCSFGSHSHHHGIMNAMLSEELTENLQASKTILESLTGRSITHLAFPNGDSDRRVRQILEATGYRWGYSTAPGLVHAGTDPYQIPRTMIGAFEDMETILFKLSRQILMHAFNRRKG
ncbi:MAG: polysaccharide deacetylase family protein [Desulfatitalea sp.]